MTQAGARRRFSPEDKARLVAQVKADKAGGMTKAQACLKADISESLYDYWANPGSRQKQRERGRQRSARYRKQVVKAAKAYVKPKSKQSRRTQDVLDDIRRQQSGLALGPRVIPAWDVAGDRKYLCAIMADGSSALLFPADAAEAALAALKALA